LKLLAGYGVGRPRPVPEKRGRNAEVDLEIARLKAQLDQHADDDPSLWPLRKQLVALYRKRQGLLGGGA
jgi:hypothetical protein